MAFSNNFVEEGFVEEKPEFPQCSNLPEPGRVVQNLVENEDGTCKFEYEITRFPVGLCTGTFDGVKFKLNILRLSIISGIFILKYHHKVDDQND